MNILNEKAINSNHAKRAVIYCRVSTEEQAQEGESLSAQERRCLSFCENHGYVPAAKFIEEGESGRTQDRTQLKRLLAFCFDRTNQIAAVICLKQDRFSRNLFDYRKLEQALSRKGISLIFAEGNNEQSAQGKLFRNINGFFAEFESDINSERTKAGMAEAILNGRWIRPLLGYSFRDNPQGKRQLYPNDKADIVRKIFDLASRGVYTQVEIIAKLKSDDFIISKQSLSKLLRNSVYCGLLPDIYGQNGGNYIKGIHEPLISQETFREVQNVLSGRRANIVPKKRNNPAFPLRRFVVCPKCGKLLTASFAQGKKIKVGYYQCTTKGCPRFQKKILEPKFLEYLRNAKPSDKTLKLFEEEFIKKFKVKEAEFKKYKQRALTEITALKTQKNRIIDLLAKGIISEHDGKEKLSALNAEIEDKTFAMNESAPNINITECWEFAKEFICNMDNLWESGDLALRQRIQGLITPKGFVFDGELIKPLKSPHFMGAFALKNTSCQLMGG